MSNDELAKTLEKLHEELSQSPNLDERTLRSMRAILEEIQSTIVRNDSAQPATNAEPPTITQRLQEMISDFEARHPQLTATLSQIADRLTDMGI
jgi:DNA repair exonuclease SbcCD ATPase subunit